MQEKILGYLLLTVGLLLVVISAFNVYEVFTGRSMPIKIFNLPGISMDITKFLPQQTQEMPQISGLPPNIDLSKIMQAIKPTTSGNKSQEIVSADMVNLPLNYLTNIMLMGFILNVGVKVAGLGIQLIRPIVVKLHPEPEKTPNQKGS